MSDGKLWCVRISSAVVPAESEIAALRWANNYNLRMDNLLSPTATVELWPYEKEEHAETFKHSGIYLVGDTAYYNNSAFNAGLAEAKANEKSII